MLDNLRESASQSPFFQDQDNPEGDKSSSRRNRHEDHHFLGMTPAQRFVIALMLFMMVCVFGTFILIATEKIWL